MQPESVNVWDYERLAEERLDPGAWGYYAGGAGDEWTLRENLAAWNRWQLRPRVLVDVGEVNAATTVLDTEVSMPLLVAPTAYHRVADPEGEAATARAAAAARTIMCLSMLATATPEEVAAAAPAALRWYQVYVYTRREVTWAFVERALEVGFRTLVLTVDVPAVGRRERDLRTGFALPEGIEVPSMVAATAGEWSGKFQDVTIDPTLSWLDLEELSSRYDVPVLVKGILSAEDARLAADHGAAGVVVSNHGGRQLDGVPATLDVLPEVVEEVGGEVEVLIDGGVRRGTDVVKALALGAKAVLTGRPVIWGLAVDGEAGARRVLELLQAEIELALALVGAPTPALVTRDHIRPAPR
jgi:isopentenyl diphosphate isomerase/L-lactate dehydrogenase-like FMN-dependent dehydrogenase